VHRLIQTSRGTAVFDLLGAGLGIRVISFGSDGWEDRDKTWYEVAEEQNQQSLGQFLAVELAVPSDEAEALARTLLGPWTDEWRSRGGERDAKTVGRLAVAFVASLAILLLLACLAIALVIWLFAT
jgi:hypothetical protein